MTDATLIGTLAAWCADSRVGFPAAARHKAAVAIADTLACMLAGRDDPVSAAARRATPPGTGPAAAVGFATRISVEAAAFVNGVAAHALDFDDCQFPSATHPSAVMVPALLALADRDGSPGVAVADAYVAGLEVAAVIAARLNPRHYAFGWHSTSTIALIGAAAGCGRLIGLDAAGIAAAISLATSLAAGSKRQFGTPAKPLHAGFAARNGVLAATLAEAGLAASAEPFEGPWGFFDLHHAERPEPVAPPALYPRSALAIDDPGVVAKLYPCCYSTCLGIDGLLALRAGRGLAAAEVEAVDITLPPYMAANLPFTDPQTVAEARFSMQWCAAVALADGVPRLGHFGDTALADTRLRRLATRVTHRPAAQRPEAAALPWGGEAMVRVTLVNGDRLETLSTWPKGSMQNPLTADELLGKVRDCAGPALGRAGAEALHDLALALPASAGLADLTGRLRGLTMERTS